MYEAYWGLSESPFRNRIDPRWYYASPQHNEALARSLFLVEERRRCGTLTGPAGTGKSLLLSVLAKEVRRTQRQVAFVDAAELTGQGILWELAAALHLAPSVSASHFDLWRTVSDHLQGQRLAGFQTVLLFDHVEQARTDCLPTLERLVRLEGRPDCWTTIILSARSFDLPYGSSLLAELTDLRIQLAPFNQHDTSQYVHALLKTSGCDRDLFSDETLEAIFKRTRGIPREVNRVCDLSLLAAMGEQHSRIDPATLSRACEELQLQ